MTVAACTCWTSTGRSSPRPATARHYRDLYGNPCLRVTLPAGRSSLRYDALAEVTDAVEDANEDAREVPPDELPDDVLLYTLPSRYCLPDLLADEAWSRFGTAPPGYRRVRGHLRARPPAPKVPLRQHHRTVHRRRRQRLRSGCLPGLHPSGDLVLPRAQHPGPLRLRLPTRDRHAPSGVPTDFAAWLEVWLADRWWTFDPRNNTRRKGRIVIGAGRDAADVAMATTFGGPELESMTVHAKALDGLAAHVHTGG